MPRSSRKPKMRRPSTSPVALIHYRDESNERSVCNAEERATYTGDTVICSTDASEVTCGLCLRGIPKSINPRPADVRRKHSRSGQVRCDICAPLRCSKAP